MAPYRRLPSEQSFRLLRLAPGEEIDDLEGCLEVHSLEHYPAYETISYAWGSPDLVEWMLLDGNEFRITAQARAALLRVRNRTTPRLLWIDAICINQEDKVERASQVVQMSRIYTNATCVLCYLGDDVGEEDSAVAIQLIQKIGAVDFSRLNGLSVSDSFLQRQGLPPPKDHAWQQTKLFLDRPWFRRAWAVQEFVCGSDCLLICGKTQQSWKALCTGIELMEEYSLFSWGLAFSSSSDANVNNQEIAAADNAVKNLTALNIMFWLKSSRKLSDTYGAMLRSFVKRDETAQQELVEGGLNKITPELAAAVDQLRGDPEVADFVLEAFDPVMKGIFSAMGIEDTLMPKLPLLQLHKVHLNTLSSDPRDKLFSLLSISAEHQEPELRPSYTECTDVVFTRYARFFLRRADPGSLDSGLLLSAGWKRETQLTRPGTPHLPSWVPDFATSTGNNTSYVFTLPAGLSYGHQAGGATSLSTRFDDAEPRVLHVRGSQVGTITKILPPLSKVMDKVSLDYALTQDSAWLPMVDYFDGIDTLFLLRDGDYQWRKDGETNYEVLWRTLISNTSDRQFVPGDEYRENYENFRSFLEKIRCGECEQEDLPGRGKAIVQSPWAKQWLCLTGKFLVVCETDSGLLGLVPSCCQVGDKVVVLSGEPMPFVLRELTGGLDGKHEFFGACYMHGIMHGEAVEAESWNEEEFHLL